MPGGWRTTAARAVLLGLTVGAFAGAPIALAEQPVGAPFGSTAQELDELVEQFTSLGRVASPAPAGAHSMVVVADDRAALTAALGLGVRATDVWDDALFGFSAVLTDEQVVVLEGMAGIEAVEPDVEVHALIDQVDPPWGLDRVDQRNLPLDSTYTHDASGGAGVTAYVVDSGLWLTHQQFAGRVQPGAYADFGDGSGPFDCDGHGTHVTGILGGSTFGVAKGVTIKPIKVLDCEGSGPVGAVLAGLDFIADDHDDGEPAVVNLSIGAPVDADATAVDTAVQALIDEGITVVAAAGNDAEPTCDYSPARVPDVITVAASNRFDAPAAFSNAGPCNDLFAPGVGILSAAPDPIGSPNPTDNRTATMSGTSMAAPHVAGAAALILADDPTATPAEVWAAIDADTTRDVIDGDCCGEPDKLLHVTANDPPGIPDDPDDPDDPGDSDAVALTPVVPIRIVDTRAGEATIDGLYAGIGRSPAGGTLPVRVAGRADVPDDAQAVMLNVTAVAPSAPGFLTVYPCGAQRPVASSVNYAAGQIVPNAVLAAVGDDGAICVYSSAPADVIVDLTGYVPNGGSPVTLVPGRLLDTRAGEATIDGQASGIGRRLAGSVLTLPVTNRAGVPGDASAVMLNVTAVAPDSAGFLTVFPCGTQQPLASNVNYIAGQVVPNAVLTAVGAGGVVCVFTSSGADVIVDVNGYVPAGATPTPTGPSRLLDTRAGERTVDGAQAGVGRVAAGQTITVVVGGRAGIASDSEAVMLNVTAVRPGAPGFLTVYRCDADRPLASSVNFTAGQVVPNAVFSAVGAGGTVCIYSSADTDVIVDVTGTS